MSSFGNDLTESYLDQVYETLNSENMRLMTDLKTDKNSNPEKEVDIGKQISSINTLMFGILKLRNLKKKIALKINM